MTTLAAVPAHPGGNPDPRSECTRRSASGRLMPLPPPLRPWQAAREGHDPLERMAAHALDWVTLSVPAGAAVYSPVDRRLHLFTTAPVVVKLDAAWDARRLERVRLEYLVRGRGADPYAPSRWNARGTTVVGPRDVGGRGTFSRSVLGELLATDALGSQASMFIRRDGSIVAAVILLRTLDDPEFSADELRLLGRSQPFLAQALTLAADQRPASPPIELARLTPRQQDVARLAANGATNAEIASTLFVSVATVKTHMTQVLEKLQLRSRTELAMLLRPSR
jgi:DNA-binding CsgD family transcriptional regulator